MPCSALGSWLQRVTRDASCPSEMTDMVTDVGSWYTTFFHTRDVDLSVLLRRPGSQVY